MQPVKTDLKNTNLRDTQMYVSILSQTKKNTWINEWYIFFKILKVQHSKYWEIHLWILSILDNIEII